MPPAATNGKNNTDITNLNNPKANPNMKGRNLTAGADQRPAAGATIGNLNAKGERSMGFQRPGAPNAAAGYTQPSDIRKPGGAPIPGRDGQKLDKKQTGLSEPVSNVLTTIGGPLRL